MKYNLAITTEQAEAYAYLAQIAEKKQIVEIKKFSPKRSINQNSYLHVLLGAFGAHFGWTMEEAKGVYKRLPGNKEVYIEHFDDRGVQFEYERSSAALTKEEMTKTIDTLRTWSKKMGYPLPSADEKEWLMRLENEVEKASFYL